MALDETTRLVRAARKATRYSIICRAACQTQCAFLCRQNSMLCIAERQWGDLGDAIVDALERQEDIENGLNGALAQALAMKAIDTAPPAATEFVPIMTVQLSPELLTPHDPELLETRLEERVAQALQELTH